MRKCQACQENLCKGEYRFRNYCKDPNNCSCTCLEQTGNTVVKAAGSIALGALSIGGGVALTIMTGGLGALFGGAALMGAGSSMVTKPIFKKVSGERMTAGDYITDVAVGTACGALTAGIGSGLSAAVKPVGAIAKTAVRVLGGALSGAVTNVTSDVATKVVNGEDVTLESTAAAAGRGLLVGSIAGAGARISGSSSAALTKMASGAATGAIGELAAQACDGEFDIKKIGLAASTSLIVTGTMEGSKNATYALNGGKVNVSNRIDTRDIADKTERDAARVALEKMNNLPPEEIMKKIQQAEKYNVVKTDVIEKIKQLIQQKQELIQKEGKLTKSQTKSFHKQIGALNNEAKQVKPVPLKDSGIHALTGERIKQMSADVHLDPNNPGTDRAAGRRVVADVNLDTKKVHYADYSGNHDHSSMKGYGERTPTNPSTLLDPIRNYAPHLLIHDEEDEKNK